jgi:hypothetical protein
VARRLASAERRLHRDGHHDVRRRAETLDGGGAVVGPSPEGRIHEQVTQDVGAALVGGAIVAVGLAASAAGQTTLAASARGLGEPQSRHSRRRA